MQYIFEDHQSIQDLIQLLVKCLKSHENDENQCELKENALLVWFTFDSLFYTFYYIPFILFWFIIWFIVGFRKYNIKYTILSCSASVANFISNH